MCKVAVLFILICVDAINVLSHKVFYNQAIDECDSFFQRKPWPMPKEISSSEVVKLCQTQMHGTKRGKVVFASLFSPKYRIPIYTANTISLNKSEKIFPRPPESAWERVAIGLCNLTSIPQSPIFSDIGRVDHYEFSLCKKYQAVSEDYSKNKMDFDRGHLSPSHINARDIEKVTGTFTLTNAAPQYAKFNEYAWEKYECITEHTIMDLVPNELVYIITGTYGSALDKEGKPLWLNKNNPNKSPVKVPGYYWKAVCYPGSQEKEPWGYAIVMPNVDRVVIPLFQNYVTLQKFSEQYFDDVPFGPECMNASFGKFASILKDWETYLHKNCD